MTEVGIFLDLSLRSEYTFPWFANQREPEVRDESGRLVHEEMSEDQGAKHLQSSNAFLGAPFVEGPGVVLSRDLVVEPEDLRLGGGVHVGIAIIRCTSVTSP